VTAHNVHLTRALLHHGADPACLDRDDQTPLELAQRLWDMRRCHNDPKTSSPAPAAAMVELLLAHAAGDEWLLLSDVPVGGKGGQEEYENPLRFVKGQGVR
jgi:hypothetical protein